MSDVHLYVPEATTVSYRVLRKGCRKFMPEKFDDWRSAFEHGCNWCHQGFRVFRQKTYKWHDPTNTELIKVGKLYE